MSSSTLNSITLTPNLIAGQHICAGSSDKSITHRALILAACAEGTSHIYHASMAADCMSTLNACQVLGAEIVVAADHCRITSAGAQKFKSPQQVLDFHNSGTTARLLVGLLAALAGRFFICCGDKSLSVRPMRELISLLRDIGAQIMARNDDQHLPLAISGTTLTPRRLRFDTASAQLKSALLLAGMHAEAGQMHINLPSGTRQHTEEMLRMAGVDCHWQTQQERQLLTLTCPYSLPPLRLKIPNDPSSAAYFVALVLLSPVPMQVTLRNLCADPNRLGFVEVIKAMQGDVRLTTAIDNRGYATPVCDLTACSGNQLQAVMLEQAIVPKIIDEVMILALLAAFATGESQFKSLSALRSKESDRLTAIAVFINNIGGKATILADASLIVQGTFGIGDKTKRPRSFTYDPAGDHRLAMTASICALLTESTCTIHQPACVGVSFPDFFAQLQALHSRA
ncbi:MAG: 3-phosphoshikimate 1-carboxyvinyltransferase [Pseudomonadota bacterium]|nr:3-phosphoshikimate 1-carboxyvinyltransferase [Pseudomonadota bacterium]